MTFLQHFGIDRIFLSNVTWQVKTSNPEEMKLRRGAPPCVFSHLRFIYLFFLHSCKSLQLQEVSMHALAGATWAVTGTDAQQRGENRQGLKPGQRGRKITISFKKSSEENTRNWIEIQKNPQNYVASLSLSVTREEDRRVQNHPAGRAPISHCRAQLVSEIRARVPGALTHITVESLHLASCWHRSIDSSIPHYPGGFPLPRGCYNRCPPPLLKRQALCLLNHRFRG